MYLSVRVVSLPSESSVLCFFISLSQAGAFYSMLYLLHWIFPICTYHFYVSVQFSSVALSCTTLCDPHGLQHSRPPCITNSWSLLKLMSIESVMPSNHLILCHPLLLPPSIFPSIRVFSNELALHIRWPKYWSSSISPPKEYSRLMSFRMDWLDLFVVQGTLRSFLQHHSSKASILQHSAFFTV